MRRLVLGLGVAAAAAAAVSGYLLFGSEEEVSPVADTATSQQQAAEAAPSSPPQDAPATAPAEVREAVSDATATTATAPAVVSTTTPSDTEAAPEAATPPQRPQVVQRAPATASKPPASSEDSEPSGAEAPSAPGPTFDVVRVEPTGETVIAGRAEPNSDVTVTLGESDTVGTVRADRSGAWAIVAEKPLEPGTHEIGIESETPKGEKQLSENLVVVVVPKPKVPAQPAAVPDADSGPEAAKQDAATVADAGDAKADEPASSQVLALLTPRAGGGATKVLPQQTSQGIAEGSLVLDSVDYDENGRAVLGGRSEPGARMLVYLDNGLIGEAVAGDDGRWILLPEDRIAEGLHRLRVDQVDGSGSVLARVETPFSREAPRPVEAGEAYVIVQPGNSLWRIARRTYGRGRTYTVIYQANADQIRDPDLIYPGQVFELPRVN